MCAGTEGDPGLDAWVQLCDDLTAEATVQLPPDFAARTWLTARTAAGVRAEILRAVLEDDDAPETGHDCE